MSNVAETLVAWREAERRLEAADDPGEIAALAAEAARLHTAYRKAIAAAGEVLDVRAHGERSDDRNDPKP